MEKQTFLTWSGGIKSHLFSTTTCKRVSTQSDNQSKEEEIGDGPAYQFVREQLGNDKTLPRLRLHSLGCVDDQQDKVNDLCAAEHVPNQARVSRVVHKCEQNLCF